MECNFRRGPGRIVHHFGQKGVNDEMSRDCEAGRILRICGRQDFEDCEAGMILRIVRRAGF